MHLRVAAVLLAALLARAAPARAQTPAPAALPVLTPLIPAELTALRPLIARGPVIIPRGLDWGTNAQATVYLSVHAPAETVYRVIAAPEEYPAFMPAVSHLDVLSRHERRTAFRFHATAAVFDVQADAVIHAVNPRRIDFLVPRSDLGRSSSRWDVLPDGPNDTTLVLTVWTDPTQATWIVRQTAGASSYGPSSVDITVGSVLALAVKRRAEVLAGAHLPPRPARAAVAPAVLTPLPAGSFYPLTHDYHIISLVLDANGSLVQTSVIAYYSGEPARFARRIRDVEHYGSFWPWVHPQRVLARGADSVRFHMALGAPLSPANGDTELTSEPGGRCFRFDGVGGDFAGERHRWDLNYVPGDGTYVVYGTGGSEVLHAPLFHRALIDRDPWTAAGMSAYWTAVMARYAVLGLPD